MRREKTSVSQEDYLKAIWEMVQEEQTPISAHLAKELGVESKAILKQCITARAALAELKQAAELIPNQGMLINTLPLLEARAAAP